MKRKLLHYFESHLIHVVTSFGLGEIVRNCLTTGTTHNLHTPNGGQVLGLGAFCGQMDRHLATALPVLHGFGGVLPWSEPARGRYPGQRGISSRVCVCYGSRSH
jgi:hypothetical protein